MILKKLKKIILNCPKCNNELKIEENSIYCMNCDYVLQKKDDIFMLNEVDADYEEFMRFKGPTLRERVNAVFSTSKYEYKIYSKFIKNSIKDKSIKDKIILEIGAGDGRFTEILAENNYVIANDINYNALKRCHDSLSLSDREKVIFICSSYEKLPQFNESIDLLVAIECLLYSKNRFEKVFKKLLKNIKKGGFIIDSEPLKASAVLYSLLENDLDNVYSLLNGVKIEKLGGGEEVTQSRVFTIKELKTIYNRLNLVVKKEEKTPELISILSLLISQKKMDINLACEILENNLNDFTDNGRCFIALLQKF